MIAHRQSLVANSMCRFQRRQPTGSRLRGRKSRRLGWPKKWYQRNGAARWHRWAWPGLPCLLLQMPGRFLRPSWRTACATQRFDPCRKLFSTCSSSKSRRELLSQPGCFPQYRRQALRGGVRPWPLYRRRSETQAHC